MLQYPANSNNSAAALWHPNDKQVAALYSQEQSILFYDEGIRVQKFCTPYGEV